MSERKCLHLKKIQSVWLNVSDIGIDPYNFVKPLINT